MSQGFYGQSIPRDLLICLPSSLTRSGQGLQQYGASREDPSGECGAGAASSCQSPRQYLWGPDHGLDGERGHHCSQVGQSLDAFSPLFPEAVSSARGTLAGLSTQSSRSLGILLGSPWISTPIMPERSHFCKLVMLPSSLHSLPHSL